MSQTELSPSEIRTRGYAALLKALGPLDFARFVQQTEAGQGDYTQTRATATDGFSVDDIQHLIEQRRRAKDQ